jgi:hypothetical protein
MTVTSQRRMEDGKALEDPGLPGARHEKVCWAEGKSCQVCVQFGEGTEGKPVVWREPAGGGEGVRGGYTKEQKMGDPGTGRGLVNSRVIFTNKIQDGTY